MSISKAVGHLLEATTPDGPELDSAIEELVPVVSRCGDPDALEGIRTAATKLRLRNTQRQQRETQLQGLLHTAQRLLNVSAVDQLLQVILTATQDLLGCDVAHLNLRERNEAGFETLRACEGALTEAFRRQQTAPGSGITGRVTTTKSAYVTDHYLTDSLINHDPTGDAAVAGEGLRTLAGVPLFSGEEVIGVLVASFRVPTTVSSDQLGVLAALGSLTALAVSSARLHEEKEEALHGLESVNAIVQGTNELLEWSASAHDRLTTLALEGAELSQIVAAVHELIGGLAAAADINGTVMTSCPQTDQLTIPGEAAESVAHTGRALRMDQPDGTTIWVAPAIASGELLGSIAIVRGNEHTADRELNELQRRTLERAGMIMALLELMNRSTAEAELRLAGEVVADLVTGGERSATAARRARSIGFPANSPCVVIVAQCEPREASAMRRVGLNFARARAGLTDAHHDKLTVILPSDDGAAAVHDLWQILTDHLAGPVNVGGSRPTSEVEALPIANAEATRCLNAVQQLAGGASWGTPESLGFIGLILRQSKSREVHDFIRSTLGPLVDYDASRGTELVATVATYLRCERSLRSAARELHVHHNTILQRLQRAGILLGEDWQTPERLLELQLALRLNLLQTESRA